jgi:transcriptional regulator with XRE-family HTH domain
MSGSTLRADAPKIMAEPFRYKMCGLDNVFLLNGVEFHHGDYGRGVSIYKVEELHRKIGMHLILRRKALSPKEMRFLRKQMELTQAELARYLGVTSQTVARYEKGETEIPGPVDRLVRLAFALHVSPADRRAKLLEEIIKGQQQLQEMDEESAAPLYFGSTPRGWHEGRRAA